MPEISTTTQSPDAWPFFRDRPTPVVLDVRPGHDAKPLPPVRIFLGTEEAQYRAERIFFYSIEQVRDPGRVYEIHLMKNVTGFDRRRWRTGFTNYRYAIPQWAGGEGKAIYNDVDQIYLADPALLFDLEMGNHGYLAISAKDTSVMLIDCGRMIDLWNIESASKLGKHALIDKPSSTPGLWGALDGHWNARDQEYIEGRTKCLHYTALHQQPWEPTPEVFSYHPNPLAYVWHDLERAADADGYDVFTSASPSPEFAPALAAARAPATTPGTPELARDLFGELAVADIQHLQLADGGATKDSEAKGGATMNPAVRELGQGRGITPLALEPGMAWPEEAADAVVASGLLPQVPPADLPWLLGRLFRAARKVVHVDAVATAAEGLGSAEWWRQRLDRIALRHPTKSWSLTVEDKAAAIPGTVRHFVMRARPMPENGRVWALVEDAPALDRQVRALAQALPLEPVEKELAKGALGGRSARPGSMRPPWPDVVVAAGPRSARLARRIKAASRGAARTVQIGHPGTDLGHFDLVVANPADRLPIRPNTAQVTAPLSPPAAPAAAANDAAANAAASAASDLALAVLGPVRRPFKRAKAELEALGQALEATSAKQKAVYVMPGASEEDRRALLAAAPRASVILADQRPLEAAMAEAAALVLFGDDPAVLALAAASGTPATLVPLPYWYDGIPGSRPVKAALTLLVGGGTSYRGTPHQQHALARMVDRLVVAGWLRLPHDPGRLQKALIARGLLHPLDAAEPMARPHPLDDLERLTEAVHRLLTRQYAAS